MYCITIEWKTTVAIPPPASSFDAIQSGPDARSTSAGRSSRDIEGAAQEPVSPRLIGPHVRHQGESPLFGQRIDRIRITTRSFHHASSVSNRGSTCVL